MEASDFSGYSSWGDERNRRDFDDEVEVDDYYQRRRERRYREPRRRAPGYFDENDAWREDAASPPQTPEGSLPSPPQVSRSARKASTAAVEQHDSREEAKAQASPVGRAAKAPKASSVNSENRDTRVGARVQERAVGAFAAESAAPAVQYGDMLRVPPDEREDLTLREPETMSAEVFVTEALHTLYRLAAMAALAAALALTAALPASLFVPAEAAAAAAATAAAAAPLSPAAVAAGVVGSIGGPGPEAVARLGLWGWVGVVTKALSSRKFQGNCALLLATAAPSLLFSSVIFDGTKMNLHDFVKVMFRSFTVGFSLCFLGEVVGATVLRVAAYSWLEPRLFRDLARPLGLPITALPWLLRDHGYRLKPLTSFVTEFLVDCVLSPVAEEAAKVLVLLHSGVLPRTGSDLARHTSVHTYLAYTMAAGTGLKLADNMRRVALYTSPRCHQKTFFAFARGIFPVHEVCCALTAMGLAKRDVLSKKMSLARLVLPAAALHGMGNFRGKKPLFKWGSHAPWVEMQLQAWSTADDAPPAKVITNGMLGLFWLSILVRATTHCCRSYYFVSRDQRRLLRMDRYTAWQHRGTTTRQQQQQQDEHGREHPSGPSAGSAGGGSAAAHAAGSADYGVG